MIRPSAPEAVQVVWFKRDLRVADHAPLLAAAARGPVLCLYVVEPEALARDDFDPVHLGFALEALAALDRALAARGARLTVRVGRVPEVFEGLWRERPFAALHSHQETGVRWTFARDRRVARWAEARGVAWHETPQDGDARGGRHEVVGPAGLAVPPLPAPNVLRPALGFTPGGVPTLRDLDLPPERVRDRQRGGEALAEGLLAAFLARRGDGYRGGVSSPIDASVAGSRLSPHLAFGTISVRTVLHAAERALARAAVEGVRDARPAGRPVAEDPLRAFVRRLRWRRDRIAELEASPRLEFEGVVPDADEGARAFDDERFAAWAEGRTGFPLVDACQRVLRDTAWVNFRMRAMLASFATSRLGLPWRAVGLHLARSFLDYDPGIHWPLVTRSAGLAGAHARAVFDPVRQARAHDPDGRFVRSQLPALAAVPEAWVVTPWRMPATVQRAVGCVLGRDYPRPVVPPSRRQARAPV
ncbi:MAG: FAD-binding domain-containing protein [Planctomycetota bacterium]